MRKILGRLSTDDRGNIWVDTLPENIELGNIVQVNDIVTQVTGLTVDKKNPKMRISSIKDRIGVAKGVLDVICDRMEELPRTEEHYQDVTKVINDIMELYNKYDRK